MDPFDIFSGLENEWEKTIKKCDSDKFKKKSKDLYEILYKLRKTDEGQHYKIKESVYKMLDMLNLQRGDLYTNNVLKLKKNPKISKIFEAFDLIINNYLPKVSNSAKPKLPPLKSLEQLKYVSDEKKILKFCLKLTDDIEDETNLQFYINLSVHYADRFYKNLVNHTDSSTIEMIEIGLSNEIILISVLTTLKILEDDGKYASDYAYELAKMGYFGHEIAIKEDKEIDKFIIPIANWIKEMERYFLSILDYDFSYDINEVMAIELTLKN